MMARVAALHLALCVLAVPAAAHAVSPADRAAADALFKEGCKLVAAGNFVEACPKFEASQKLDPGLGTYLNLADCYERLGRTATAWTHFEELHRLARQQGDERRARIAAERARRLEKHLPRLVVKVVEPVPGLTVTRDGTPLDPGAWDTPLPVDPGTHEIIVSAPGHTTWATTVDVPPGPTPTELPVPPLSPAGPTETAAPGREVQLADDAPETRVTSAHSGGFKRRVLGATVAGGGALALAVAGLYASNARSTWSEAQGHCTPGTKPLRCTSEGMALADDAARSADVATITAVLGVAAVGVGAYFWFTADDGITSVAVSPTRGGALVGLGGRF